MDALGEDAVRAARAFIEDETGAGRTEVALGEDFDRCGGVFVTLSRHPSGDLRGCIGIPEPVMPLREALEEAARSACHDPRFPPLSAEETGEVTVEVTLLTEPEDVTCPRSELPQHIVIGRDGLILSYRGYRGLLLPQVASEYRWTPEEFLSHLSLKAGLSRSTWKNESARIQSFRGKVFRETSPGGEIEEA